MIDIEATIEIEYQCMECYAVSSKDRTLKRREDELLVCTNCGKTMVYNVRMRLAHVTIR